MKKKPATSETSDREAGVDDYKYDAYEKFKPTRVRNMKGGVRLPFLNSLLFLSSSFFPCITSSHYTFE